MQSQEYQERLPVFIKPSPQGQAHPKQRFFMMGQQAAFCDQTPDTVRIEIKPLIRAEADQYADPLIQEQVYIDLWEQFWDGYNALAAFEKTLKMV